MDQWSSKFSGRKPWVEVILLMQFQANKKKMPEATLSLLQVGHRQPHYDPSFRAKNRKK